MIKATIPMLAVPDILQAVRYYRDRLGFQLAVEPTDGDKYAVFECGEAFLHLTEAARSANNGSAGDVGGVFVLVEDVDALYEALRGKGAFRTDFPKDRGQVREHPPEDKPYGYRDMIFVDPFGYRFCFAQSLESKAV